MEKLFCSRKLRVALMNGAAYVFHADNENKLYFVFKSENTIIISKDEYCLNKDSVFNFNNIEAITDIEE